jgi:hypothetical protein
MCLPLPKVALPFADGWFITWEKLREQPVPKT